MKKHLPFCGEFSILCIEYRVAVDRVVKVTLKEKHLLKTQLFDG